ncbi:hypothetical protein BDQ12DRAFT_626059 [Crucibulum laeve]|uniref:AB hydrolase-1 domain-containing protein n=1 Tax=Crucibulum laeve TaxID=68775 RepID=A0A5C3M8E7_9AGAR|nr:hypothetical protein BDQ12DRAFT_626059 [Crucibulum laeve]
MQSILSRHSSGTNSSHRTPRKSASFLSLRREKEKPPPPEHLSTDPAARSHSATYFDVYPRHKSNPSTRSSPTKTKTHRSSSSKTIIPPDLPKPSYEFPSDEPDIYTFPTFDSTDDLPTPTASHPIASHYSRMRSRSGPSSKPGWTDSTSVPQLRFSGSSSTQYTETPPRTPIDYVDSRESFEQFPVMVSAPVSGVEMMDALVDGMNGGAVSTTSSRSRFGIPGHHPLYQPPLPTPPPGVVLGGGKPRRTKNSRRVSSSDSGDDDLAPRSSSTAVHRRRKTRTSSPRTESISTITSISPTARPLLSEHATPSHTSSSDKIPIRIGEERRKAIVPSIAEIIRTHTSPDLHTRPRPTTSRASSLYTHSQSHATVHEEHESEPEPLTMEEETELLSRSSIDSVADEVQRTLRNQVIVQRAPSVPPSAFLNRHSTISDNASICSPRSDPGRTSSIYSSSAASSYQLNSPFDAAFQSLARLSPSQSVAQYLRSSRLTTLLKLHRSPHASQDNPLTVSLSDLGSPTGFPVVVFLGLGCVRHIMGLYDEMADCMGLRLITIDRWGLGRTEPRSKSAKGIVQWASVVEEVLDLLQIEQCSVMAHSAGAPYALSFANKVPSRIRGDICLLAPWVGGSESNGYKWLKYIPNGLLKTAQAAEWKLQAWMIGKPPTITYEGIGYTAPIHAKRPSSRESSLPSINGSLNVVYTSTAEGRSRPSIGSGTFSEYDDLGDFDGRFESRSTLGARAYSPRQISRSGSESKIFTNKRKSSRGFLGRLKGSSTTPNSPSEDKQSATKGLKALRSMGSLKGKGRVSKSSQPPSPQIPPSIRLDLGLELDEPNWSSTTSIDRLDSQRNNGFPVTSATFSSSTQRTNVRSEGRRSISFTSPRTMASTPSSPSPSTGSVGFGPNPDSSNYQAVLGNALIAASHAESAKGTHNDLLQILNHENYSWGFSYSSYPHDVRVWYGDKDEKIAENAVRWMERAMGSDRCLVKVVKGADHGLMYRSSVVIDVLERLLDSWASKAQT